MKQTKFILLIVGLLSVISCTNSIGNNSNSLLWKVSGNGLDKPSYIFGTHHLVPLNFLDSVAGINEAFESTEQTVGELDMSKMMEMQMQIMSQSTMPEGVTYQSLLPADDVALIDSTLVSLLGAGLEQLGTLKPAMLSNLISVTLYQKFYPSISASDMGLDQYFQEEALKRNRPVIGLETADDQIEVLLNSQTLERQAELLVCMVKNPELLKEQMDDLQVAYHAQDINALLELYEREIPNDPCPSTDEEKEAINKDRNLKWVEILPTIMAEKPSFIAVGCLHLPGEHGIIEGLRNQGFTVEAVN